MIRTQVYLTETEKKIIEIISIETGKKQSELIRQAIDRFIDEFQTHERIDLLRRAKGMWKGRKDGSLSKELRKSWDRSKIK